jgi:hypothetical protein
VSTLAIHRIVLNAPGLLVRLETINDAAPSTDPDVQVEPDSGPTRVALVASVDDGIGFERVVLQDSNPETDLERAKAFSRILRQTQVLDNMRAALAAAGLKAQKPVLEMEDLQNTGSGETSNVSEKQE